MQRKFELVNHEKGLNSYLSVNIIKSKSWASKYAKIE